MAKTGLETMHIRQSVPGDVAELEQLYPEAFPDEDLLPLVTDLLANPSIVLSLVGVVDSTLVGHILVHNM